MKPIWEGVVLLLKLTKVNASYGKVQILFGVNLEVRTGELVTLLGANGAGKSTTQKVIAGVLPATSGEIEFFGKSIKGLPADVLVQKGIRRTMETRGIFSRMAVQENLEMGAYINKEKESNESQMAYVFKLFPVLQEKRKQQAGELSGGQQQMLAIGRALMSKPTLLMFDEPSQGLAPILIEQIADALSEIKRTGIMILLVEQNVSLGLKLADRVYVLENGRIALEGKTEDVKSDDRIKRAYIGG